jgi:hydrogenase-4 component B
MMHLFAQNLFLFDPLSVFFLGTILLISLPSAVYSIGYLKGASSGPKTVLAWSLLVLFVLSMALVVMARNVFLFLVAWELMSLVSYFLVVFDTEHEKSIRAGMIYIVMTHIGTAFLIAAFLIMYKYAHSFDIFAIKDACALMPDAARNAVFLLLLTGFGTKAGIVPLHIWLPYAHPQAPSHISSIMSGVMIKTAIYGMIRFIIFTMGISSLWWGPLILIFALVSCLVGVIYALMEHDIKSLLAYHSVENIGIILLGVGLSMVFLYAKMPYLAVFSLMAGLYHLINHAIFKGLLFLCAGSIYRSTGTRDIEKLGGLIKKMPQTAAFFLIGAMAIAAIPPLNGFVSEWLTLQAFFLGAMNMPGSARLFLGISAGLLALTGGLAAACFVKAFGITFLAMPRSRYAEDALEAPVSMRAGMAFLSFLAVVFGLAAAQIIQVLAKVSGSAACIDTKGMVFTINNFTLSPQAGRGVYLSTPLLAFVLVIFVLTGFAVYKMALGGGKERVYKTWDCGYYKSGPRNEYTATAFSKPFRIAFGFFLLPYRKTQKIRESFYHIRSFTYETHTKKIFKEYIYEPLVGIVFIVARSMKRIQPGSIHLYLSYIFAALLLLMVFMNKF